MSLSINFSPTKSQISELIKLKFHTEDGKEVNIIIDLKDNIQQMLIQCLEKLKQEFPETDINQASLENLLTKKISDIQVNTILESNNTIISNKKSIVNTNKKGSEKQAFSFNINPLRMAWSRKSSLLLKNRHKKRDLRINTRIENERNKTLKKLKKHLTFLKLTPNNQIRVDRESKFVSSKDETRLEQMNKDEDFSLMKGNIFNFKNEKTETNNSLIEEKTNNIKLFSDINNTSSNASEKNNTERLEPKKKVVRKKLYKIRIKSKKERLKDQIRELSKIKGFAIPSFDYLCITRKKLKRFITESQYIFIKDCIISHVESMSYVKRERNEKNFTRKEDFGNTTFMDASMMIGGKNKMGTKKPGYSYLLAKNTLKRQESLMSKEKEMDNSKTSTPNIGSNNKDNLSSNMSIFNMNNQIGSFGNAGKKNMIKFKENNNQKNDNQIRRTTKKKSTVKSYLALSNEKGQLNTFKNLNNNLSNPQGLKTTKTFQLTNKSNSKKDIKLEIDEAKWSNANKSKNSQQNFNIFQTSSLIFDENEKDLQINKNSSKSLENFLKNEDSDKNMKSKLKSKKSLNNTLASLQLQGIQGLSTKNKEHKESKQNSKLSNYYVNINKNENRRQTIKLPISSNQIGELSINNLFDNLSKNENTQNLNINAADTISSNDNINANLLYKDINSITDKHKSDQTQTIDEKVSSLNTEIKVSNEKNIKPNVRKSKFKVYTRKSTKKSSKSTMNNRSKNELLKNKENINNQKDESTKLKKPNKEYLTKLSQTKRVFNINKVNKKSCDYDTQPNSIFSFKLNNPSLAKSSIDNLENYKKKNEEFKHKPQISALNSQNFNAKSNTIQPTQNKESIGQNFTLFKKKEIKPYPLKSQRISQTLENYNKKNINEIEKLKASNHNYASKKVNSYIENYYEGLLKDLYLKISDGHNKILNYNNIELEVDLKKKFIEPIISIFYERNLIFTIENFLFIGKIIVGDLLNNNQINTIVSK